MLAANDAARSLGALEQIPDEAEAALRMPRDARASRLRLSRLRRDFGDLADDAALIQHHERPSTTAFVNVEPNLTPCPRLLSRIDDLSFQEVLRVLVEILVWQRRLAQHHTKVVADATAKPADALNLDEPDNAALVEWLRSFVTATANDSSSSGLLAVRASSDDEEQSPWACAARGIRRCSTRLRGLDAQAPSLADDHPASAGPLSR
jgi:hypothetical protein